MNPVPDLSNQCCLLLNIVGCHHYGLNPAGKGVESWIFRLGYLWATGLTGLCVL